MVENLDAFILNKVMYTLHLLAEAKQTRLFRDNKAFNKSIEGFETLYRRLLEVPTGLAIYTIGISEILEPFFTLLQNEDANYAMVEPALDVLNSFFLQNNFFLVLNELHLQLALYKKVVHTLTSCRFEPTDPKHDELILHKNSQLLLRFFELDYGRSLSDGEVMLMLEGILALVYIPNFSDNLKYIAESILFEFIGLIVRRFDELEAASYEIIPIDCFGKKEELKEEVSSLEAKKSIIAESKPFSKSTLYSFILYLTSLLNIQEVRKHREKIERIRISSLYILETILACHQDIFLRDYKFFDLLENEIWKNVLLVLLAYLIFRCVCKPKSMLCSKKVYTSCRL